MSKVQKSHETNEIFTEHGMNFFFSPIWCYFFFMYFVVLFKSIEIQVTKTKPNSVCYCLNMQFEHEMCAFFFLMTNQIKRRWDITKNRKIYAKWRLCRWIALHAIGCYFFRFGVTVVYQTRFMLSVLIFHQGENHCLSLICHWISLVSLVFPMKTTERVMKRNFH